MTEQQLNQEIKQTLEDILIYIGADLKYADYAQLQMYLKYLIDKSKGKVI